jgi:hypothetical protein
MSFLIYGFSVLLLTVASENRSATTKVEEIEETPQRSSFHLRAATVWRLRSFLLWVDVLCHLKSNRDCRLNFECIY